MTEVGIVVTAKDKASAVLEAIGRNGDAGIGKITSGNLKQVPGQIQKASGAFAGLAASLGGMGGEIGGVVGKVAGLGSMLSGGPIAIGIAAVTAAVTVGVSVWQAYKEEAQAVENASLSVAHAFEAMDARLVEQRKNVTALSDEVRFYGMTSLQVSMAIAEEAVTAADQGDRNAAMAKKQMADQVAAKQKEFFDLDREHRARLIGDGDFARRSAALKQDIADLKEQSAALDVGLDKAAKSNEEARRALAVMKDKVEADRQEKTATEQKTQALNDFIEKLREQNAEYEKAADMQGDRVFEQYKKEMAIAERTKNEKAAYEKEMSDMRIEQERRTAATVSKVDAELAQDRAQRARDVADLQKGLLMGVGGAFSQMFQDMAQGPKDAGKNMLGNVVRSATGTIQAYAMSASAAAAFSQAGIPIIGPVLAVTAMGAMSALLMALISKLPSFHTGGIVGADAPRLPGMRPDERMVKALVGERFIAPGGGGRGEGGMTMVNNFNSVVPTTSAEAKRKIRSVSKEMDNMRRRRQV